MRSMWNIGIVILKSNNDHKSTEEDEEVIEYIEN
jgi:hypothetical protein